MNVKIVVIMSVTSCNQIVKNVSEAASSSEILVTTYPTTCRHIREHYSNAYRFIRNLEEVISSHSIISLLLILIITNGRNLIGEIRDERKSCFRP